ncbi:fimbria/pilus outer membrane usher protein [Proteus vulgaris]|uniref:fimbria/pilus outer membrane usher protein n=1 Tax=Proteus vulgaris TaxID=585 RepID=UPI0025420672|nr:fimbria/pilus outer membrane usher protein [Proteus vulgaris]WIF73539.1 fimbria/pilus outer membrane usher protein [Proteus vulgaris]
MKIGNIENENKRYYKKGYFHFFIALIIYFFHIEISFSDDYFDPSALSYGADQNIADLQSLAQFSKPGGQLPGVYLVDIYINDELVGSESIVFILNESDRNIYPVLTKSQLIKWGVNSLDKSSLNTLADDEKIYALDKIIPDASVKFYFSQQKLNVSIPQIYIDKSIRGEIDSKLWDEGISASLLNYTYSGSNTWISNTNKEHTSDQFLNLRSGLNFKGWRLRNYSTYHHNNNENKWDSIQTYLSHQVVSIKSLFTVGNVNSSGDIFDSFTYRGVLLESDESMLPNSQKGFAPIIRGIARSNAQVIIRQNDYIIYQTYVAAGAFEINDLYPTSYSGNLDVTIEEADGSKRDFVVPFSSLAIMQREGSLKYSFSSGKFDSNINSKEPYFAQATAMYGLPLDITVYGGQILAEKYAASAIGIGLNLGELGAISTDITHANIVHNNNSNNTRDSGQSYRFQYSKSMLQSGTTVTLAGYRYSTHGFYTFNEANNLNENNYNKRSRIQANLNQSLSRYGNLYLSAYQQDYWGRSGTERNINAGYNTHIKNISYGLSYSYSSMPDSDDDHQIALSMNIPLSNWYPQNSAYLTSSMNLARGGRNNLQVGVSGTALDNKQLNYAVSQSYGNQGQNASGNAQVSYNGAYGNINAGYSYGSEYQRVDYGAQGGIVLHPYGMTLSQPLGETLALVSAPDAQYVKVQNLNSVSTDSRGYAVIPYLSPYQRNNITLDINSLDDDVEILGNNKTMVPTRGAIVIANFDVKKGFKALVSLKFRDKPIPFGAIVTLADDDKSLQNNASIVGDNGVVYISGLEEEGNLFVKWGNKADQQCRAQYILSKTLENNSIQQINVSCL